MQIPDLFLSRIVSAEQQQMVMKRQSKLKCSKIFFNTDLPKEERRTLSCLIRSMSMCKLEEWIIIMLILVRENYM